MNFQDSQSLILSANAEYWSAIDGDHTLRLDYELNRDSVVFDLGGYKGEWSEQIYNRYMCRIFVFEPVPSFAAQIVERFRGNNNVTVCDFALGPKNTVLSLVLSENATSSYSSSDGDAIQAEMKEFVAFLEQREIQKIDLLKINIEGGEFELLDHLISTGCISRVKHLQVQFHNFVPAASERMENLRRRLWETHAPTYSLDWIWDSWTSLADSGAARAILTDGLRWHQQALREVSSRTTFELASNRRYIQELEVSRAQWAEDSRILNIWRRRLWPLLGIRNLIRRLNRKI